MEIVGTGILDSITDGVPIAERNTKSIPGIRRIKIVFAGVCELIGFVYSWHDPWSALQVDVMSEVSDGEEASLTDSTSIPVAHGGLRS